MDVLYKRWGERVKGANHSPDCPGARDISPRAQSTSGPRAAKMALFVVAPRAFWNTE
jgi:hypothetical protein